ncbi:MAG: hypothetical protein KBA99_12410 [Bacteroidia bacterium]|jgi:hypothetical protein|nr:hypothetical protein [Bacteroidota bacterium]MBP7246092.1 hypothetical protein [Bacteroidia bacterium]
MKKYLLLSLFVLLLPFQQLHAQDTKIAPTTEEEYVMGSVGYKMFMQMKVALKDNYKVKDINEVEYGDRKAVFKGLHRPGEEKPCAIILIYTKLRGAPEYYCIPTLDAPEILWDRFRVGLVGQTDNQQDQLQFFGFALAKAMMYFNGK